MTPAITLALTLSTGALVGYCLGVRTERRAQKRRRLELRPGDRIPVRLHIPQATIAYPVPEPVEMDERDTWGVA